MKIFYFLAVFVFSLSLLKSQDGKIILEGSYQGKNIYVQNPFTGTKKEFCTKKVLVNGKEITFKDTIVFEINLKDLGFKFGDSVKIMIIHSNDCKPKVLNPEGHRYPPYKISALKIENDSMLTWKVAEDSLQYTYIVQQFRWNRWINWDTIKSREKKDTAFYSSNIKKYFHSGKNLFRIKSEFKNLSSVTKSVEKKNPEEKEPKLWQGGQHYKTFPVELVNDTYWILYDQYGKVVKRGYGKSFCINDLKKGSYFLNYDNKMTDIGWY